MTVLWLAAAWATDPAASDESCARGDAEACAALVADFVGAASGSLRARAASPELVARGRRVLETVEPWVDAVVEARVLCQLSQLQFVAGRYSEARDAATVAVERLDAASGPDDPQTAQALHVLGLAVTELGDLDGARVALERALALREAANGSDDPNTLQVLRELAGVESRAGRLDVARQLLERVLVDVTRVHGSAHRATAAALHELGSLHQRAGEAAASAEAFTKALAVWDETVGPNHADALVTLASLAGALRDAGRYAEAIPFAERAVAVTEQVSGPDHPQTATALNTLAGILSLAGQVDRAVPLHERALAIVDAGEKPVAKARVRADYAGTLAALGALERAEALKEEAVALYEQASGAQSPSVAKALSGVASVQLEAGRLEAARRTLERALAIQEATLDPDHPSTATTLNDLGVVATREQRFDDARRFLLRALAARQAALGPGHRSTASTLNNLALVAKNAGSLEEAVSYYDQAVAAFEAALGADHPDTARATNNLAIAHQALGAYDLALPLYRRAIASEDAHVAKNLWRGTPAERRRFLREGDATTSRAVSASLLDRPTDPAWAALAADTVLRRKGRLVDLDAALLGAAQTTRDEATLELLDQLSDAESDLATLLRERPADPARGDLEAQVAELSRRVADAAAAARDPYVPVDPAAVTARIPDDAVLVEWTVYRPFDPSAARDDRWGEARVGVFVRKGDGLVGWRDLGAEDVVAAEIDALRSAILGAQDARKEGAALYATLFGPVATHLTDARLLLLVPDGAIHLVPFAALVDAEDRNLGETFRWTTLTSGRDLVRDDGGRMRSPPVVVYGADFAAVGSDAATVATGTGVVRSASVRSGWAPLPGTVREGAEVARRLDDAVRLTGAAASESALRALAGPVVLHVATHGFFLDDLPDDVGGDRGLVVTGTTASRPPPLAESPLVRSGIVLAGADADRADPADDGYLTAAEAARLDLHGTHLVVMSACETGLGQVRNGDGVEGLRRALAIAGAQAQIVSLWKVDDDATAWFMSALYRRLARGASVGDALASVQSTMASRTSWRSPYYWAAFTLVGDPTVRTVADVR